MQKSCTVLILFLMLFVVPVYAAGGTRQLVSEGNRAFQQGKVEEALSAYEKALVDHPESPEIFFNKGTVLFRQGDYQAAMDAFDRAALKTTNISLEAKAFYNKGNCLFREGERQQDSDVHKALENYQTSIASYQRALELDPSLTDAAHNIEVSRLVIKTLLDEMKKKQEEAQKQQEQLQEIGEALNQLIKEEQLEIDQNKILSDNKQREGLSDAVRKGIVQLAQKQGETKKKTGLLSKKMDQYIQPDQPSPMSKAKEHVDRSIIEQGIAEELLSKKNNLDNALPAQERALEELNKALASLGGSSEGTQDKGKPQGQQEQAQSEPGEQQEPVLPRNEEAQDILREEMENQKIRQRGVHQQYRNVDKDW